MKARAAARPGEVLAPRKHPQDPCLARAELWKRAQRAVRVVDRGQVGDEAERRARGPGRALDPERAVTQRHQKDGWDEHEAQPVVWLAPQLHREVGVRHLRGRPRGLFHDHGRDQDVSLDGYCL